VNGTGRPLSGSRLNLGKVCLNAALHPMGITKRKHSEWRCLASFLPSFGRLRNQVYSASGADALIQSARFFSSFSSWHSDRACQPPGTFLFLNVSEFLDPARSLRPVIPMFLTPACDLNMSSRRFESHCGNQNQSVLREKRVHSSSSLFDQRSTP